MSEEDTRVVREVAAGSLDALAAAQDAQHAGHNELVIACIDAGFRRGPPSPEFLAFAARHFAAHPAPEREAEIRTRLAETGAPAEDLMAIAHTYLSRGDAISAEGYLAIAVGREPADDAARLMRVSVLQRLGRPREGLFLLLPKIRSGAASETEYLAAVASAQQANKTALALRLCAAALRRYPDSRALIERHAGLIYAGLPASEAVAALEARRSRFVHFSLATPLYLLSGLQAQLGDFTAALHSVRDARGIDSASVSMLQHEIALLGQLGFYDEAAELCTDLLARDGDGAGSLSTIFTIFIQVGRYEDCVGVGAKLILQRPGDTAFISVYNTVLEKYLYSKLLSSENSRERKAESFPLPSRTNITAPLASLSASIRTILALFIRETKTRFGRSRLGYLWVIFEPLAHIGILILVIGLLNRGGRAPIGPNFGLFYFTGIVPYHIFTHTAGHMMTAAPENRPLLQIPRVTLPDVFIARALLEGVTEMIVAAILIAMFLLAGMQAIPLDPLGVVFAMTLLWLSAWGVGMINAVVVAYVAGWERVWGALMSVLYFSSGTFFIPRMMPQWVRDILMWNPILQGIEMVRVNYFHEPDPQWLMPAYLAGWALVPLAIGFALQNVFRRRLLDPE
jgi:capsular polysaccharide transport system permease protein